MIMTAQFWGTGLLSLAQRYFGKTRPCQLDPQRRRTRQGQGPCVPEPVLTEHFDGHSILSASSRVGGGQVPWQTCLR